MSQSDEVKKILVQPYPIDAAFSGDLSGTAKIYRLVPLGMQMETAEPVKVQDKLDFKWEMPVTHKPLQATVRVMKTYDQYRGKDSEGKIKRLIECHFIEPDQRVIEFIKKFCQVIGQKL